MNTNFSLSGGNMMRNALIAVVAIIIIYFVYTTFIAKQGLDNYGMSPNYWLLRSKQKLYGAPIPAMFTQSQMKQGLRSQPYPQFMNRQSMISKNAHSVQGMIGGAPTDAVLSAIGAGQL